MNVLETESDYPYEYKDRDNCTAATTNTSIVGNITTYTNITKNSVDALKAALMVGPVAIDIQSYNDVLATYTSGIITANCTNTDPDDAMVVVGYDTDAKTGVEYFLVKNSWGEMWGDHGYLKIAATPDN